MKKHLWLGIISCYGLMSAPSYADQTSGVISNTAFLSFVMAEKGTLREFKISSKTTQYQPDTWRPAQGDEVKVTFAPTPQRGGAVNLVVNAVELVKAGPETVTALANPVVVEVVEAGRMAVRVKIPSGQIVRFWMGRDTVRVPAGLVLVAGQKIQISFRNEKGKYFATKIEKQD